MMQTLTAPSQRSIIKSIDVNVPADHAFLVFTERFATWWPLASHHIGAAEAATAVMEPRVGGRWFERGIDGSECMWGHVLAWEPPHRVVLRWEISAKWQHDPDLHTEVEVRFIEEGEERTRVELEHRYLENFGDDAATMHAAFDTENAWAGLLRDFAAAAEAK